MESKKDSKRKKDTYSDEDENDRRREKTKRARSRSRSRSPNEKRDKEYRRKRRHSKSKSPQKQENGSKNNQKESASKKSMPERKAKETDMLNTRTGGAYIPPARLRMMQAQITDKSSVAYQRLAWEALKKSIHGHINKINVGNIGIIIKELLKENIVRGRGLLCRSVIQAQAASPTFTNVYAALVSAVNSRFPNIGELLLKRLVIQFKRGFKRNDKPICISSASFIAHLVNQRVAHEILALELLTLLVETPTDDSVEVAIAFLKECGQKLTEVSSKGVNAIFEMLRNILHEGQLDKRVQYMIEVMFQVWKDGFKDHPALIEELELVPEEEQFTHLLMLDDATDSQDILNVFKFDDKYEENEQKYKTLSKEILGSDAESGEDGSGESGSEESDDEEEDGEEKKEGVTIIDNTETNLVALRRTIYLTINSSLDFEECAHKLMKMQLKPGQEVELCHMFLDCCAEQRTYEKFYGLLAQRFCNINRIYIGPFEDIFKDSYSTAHRLDTNRLRNVSKFFAHLLFTDSISWEALECVKLNEEDTTSSSRIYIKILFQELAEYMGLKKLNDRLRDPTLQGAFAGIFPRDNPKNTRFSINFFTSIGLGGLTDELREHLKQMPKNVPPLMTEINVASSSDSSSSSSSSDSSSSDSSSDSESEGDKSKKKKDKSSKNKKDKAPETPQEPVPDKAKDGERWGHDGFYDTYGKDARRPDRPDPEKDVFARPRDVRRGRGNDIGNGNGRRYESRDREEQDPMNRRDHERNDDSRRYEKDRRVDDHRNEENEKRYERDSDRHIDDHRSNRDRKKYDNRNDREKDGDHRGEKRYERDAVRRNNERSSDRNRGDEDREVDKRGDNGRREKRYDKDDDRWNSRDKRIDEDDDRQDVDHKREKRRNSNDDRRDENYRHEKRYDKDGGKQDSRDKRRDDDEDRRNGRDKRKYDEEDRRDDNPRREKGRDSNDDNHRREKRRDDEDDKREENYRREKRNVKDDDRQEGKDKRRGEDDNRRDDNLRREKRRDDEDDRRDENYRREKRNDKDDDRQDARENRRDEDGDRRDDKYRREKRYDKGDARQETRDKRRDEDDDKYRREKRYDKDDDRCERRDKRKDEDDESKEKRRKDKRKDTNPDDWDIHRASSIRRETNTRYWDIKKVSSDEEGTPEIIDRRQEH